MWSIVISLLCVVWLIYLHFKPGKDSELETWLVLVAVFSLLAEFLLMWSSRPFSLIFILCFAGVINSIQRKLFMRN
jgi:hypothetical protein